LHVQHETKGGAEVAFITSVHFCSVEQGKVMHISALVIDMSVLLATLYFAPIMSRAAIVLLYFAAALKANRRQTLVGFCMLAWCISAIVLR
jgi:hypothetical protein